MRLSVMAGVLLLTGGTALGMTVSNYDHVRTNVLNDVVTRAQSLNEGGFANSDVTNPTVVTPITPSGDNAGLHALTTGSQKTKMRPQAATVTDMSVLFTFMPGDGMAGTSNYNLLELRSSMRLNMFGVSSGGTTTIGFDDKTGTGAVEAVSFGVPTNQWQEWFIQISGNAIKIYDISGAGPWGAGNLLVDSTFTLGGGSTSFLTIGDESSSGGKDADFIYDEVYIEKSTVPVESLVPEPASLLLVLVAGPLVMRRRPA